MTNYKNINCSLTQLDFNYIESANAYWLKYDLVYTKFIDFVGRCLINELDLKILRLVAEADKNISDPTKFVTSLKKQYLKEVEDFCIKWNMPLRKKGGVVNGRNTTKSTNQCD